MKTMLKIDLHTLSPRLLKSAVWLKALVKQLLARVEVQFWALITYWMSESSLVQSWVVQVFTLSDRISRQRARLLRQAFMWGGAGWLAGLLLGILGF